MPCWCCRLPAKSHSHLLISGFEVVAIFFFVVNSKHPLHMRKKAEVISCQGTCHILHVIKPEWHKWDTLIYVNKHTYLQGRRAGRSSLWAERDVALFNTLLQKLSESWVFFASSFLRYKKHSKFEGEGRVWVVLSLATCYTPSGLLCNQDDPVA